MRRYLILSVVLLLVGACAASPTASSGSQTAPPADTKPPPAPTKGGRVVVATSAEVDGLNPLASQWSGPGYQIGRSVLDPLVVMDRDNRWRPYLAKSITPNPDFTVWTFELRPGVKFHNGEVLNADALKVFFDAATSSPLSSQGYPEKPVVAKTGDMTVTLTFTKPWSEMPTALAEQSGYVIAPAQVASGDTRHPIGTGPFVFDEWIPNDHFRANRNPDYWRAGLPHLDSIEFRPLTEPASRFSALQAGNVDIIEAGNAGESKLQELRSAGFHVTADYDNVGVTNLLMNNDKPPLDDKRVRQAIVAAIDRNAFRDSVFDDSFEVADQPYPERSRWYSKVNYPAFDMERARRLVDEYEAEHGPLTISILSIAAGPQAGPQFLQQALESVGITVKLEGVEQVKFVQLFVGGDYQAVYLGSFFGAADPDGSYPFITSKGAAADTLIKLNFARYRNEAVDQALQAQRQTDDDAARHRAWAEIWNAFADDVPYAWLTYDRTAWAEKASVYGLEGFTTPDGVPLPAINRWTPFYTGVFVAP